MARANAIQAQYVAKNVDKVAAKLSVISSARMLFFFCALFLCALFTSGCHTPLETAGLSAGVLATGIATGAVSPTTEMEQVYYLGVFDPNEQVPSTIYRVRVHGQSSMWNSARFASGWVPAKLIDSLGSQVALDPNGTSAAAASN